MLSSLHWELGLIRASWYLTYDKECLGYFPQKTIIKPGPFLDNYSGNEIFTIPGQRRVKTASNLYNKMLSRLMNYKSRILYPRIRKNKYLLIMAFSVTRFHTNIVSAVVILLTSNDALVGRHIVSIIGLKFSPYFYLDSLLCYFKIVYLVPSPPSLKRVYGFYLLVNVFCLIY